MFEAESYVGHKLCWPDDLVINSLWAWARGLGVSSRHGIVSTAYGVYRHRPEFDLVPRFVHYLVRSNPFQWELQVRSKGVWKSRLQLTDAAFLDAPLPVPPPAEQAAIVRYLDHADRRISRYIRAKQRLIELLEEQKQAIIHRAVTRGLDPDVPLKPSRVEWLGDVPEHWALVPNRALVRQRKVLVGERHPYYRLLSLTKQGVIVRDVGSGRGKFSADMGTSQEVRAGDLVFCLFDVPETPRTVGLSKHDGMITGAYTVLECTGPVLAAYFEAFYRAMDDRKLLSPLYSGLRNTIPATRLLGVKTPVPPVPEQEVIVRYLDHETAAIDTTIDRTRHEIELLREYRTRLIADVVTGKLDIREAAAALSEVDPADLEDIIGIHGAAAPELAPELEEVAT